MRKFGLIGHPLGHSLSPQIHAKLFELDGKTVDYQLYDISPESLKDKFEFLKSLDGFNITIPHKIAAIEICDRLDETAKRYMTINCVGTKNGEYIGYNTDVIGFTKSISSLGTSLSSNVVLLGCGGVGRMMALETAYQGGKLTIAVRDADLDVAYGIKADIEKTIPNSVVCVTTLDKLNGSFDLMINSTPVGMYPNVDAMPIKSEVLANVEHLFEAIYNPRETLLMKEAQKYGVKISGGMAMLVWQAVAAHEIWDGSVYKTDDILTLISEMEKLV